MACVVIATGPFNRMFAKNVPKLVVQGSTQSIHAHTSKMLELAGAEGKTTKSMNPNNKLSVRGWISFYFIILFIA